MGENGFCLWKKVELNFNFFNLENMGRYEKIRKPLVKKGTTFATFESIMSHFLYFSDLHMFFKSKKWCFTN